MKKRSSHRWSVNKSVSGVGWVVWPPGCGPNRFDTFEDAWKFVSLRLSDPDANVIESSLAKEMLKKFQSFFVTPEVAYDISCFAIRALRVSVNDMVFLNFGSWLAEELGHPLNPVDLESCLDDWKKMRVKNRL